MIVFNGFLVCLNAFLVGFNYAAWKDRGLEENEYAFYFGLFSAVFCFAVGFL